MLVNSFISQINWPTEASPWLKSRGKFPGIGAMRMRAYCFAPFSPAHTSWLHVVCCWKGWKWWLYMVGKQFPQVNWLVKGTSHADLRGRFDVTLILIHAYPRFHFLYNIVFLKDFVAL